jgi:hypothetical protein
MKNFLLTIVILLAGCSGMPLYRSVEELKSRAEHQLTLTTDRDVALVYRDIGRAARSTSKNINGIFIGANSINMREISELDPSGEKGYVTMLQGYTTRIAHYEITKLPSGNTEVKAWWSRFNQVPLEAIKSAVSGGATLAAP